MKYLIFTYFSLCLLFTLQAQEATAHKQQFGIQVNHLLTATFGKGEASSLLSPYSFFYKRKLNEKLNLRLGLGGKIKNNIDQLKGFADKKTDSELGTDLRLGLEIEKNLGGKWSSSLGFDLLGFMSRDRNIVETGFDKVTTQQLIQGLGLGPVLGLGFRINPRLSVYTEAAAYFKYLQTTNSREFENFPQQNDLLTTITSSELDLVLPASVYLILSF